ncbi:MAG: UTP--glucose-1-phosphate uridylyltransferase, partial [Polyangiales bacterium]
MHAWREDIDPELWQHLRRYHFDEAAFAAHAAALAGGRRPTDFNALEAEVAPPASSDLPALDALTPELQASAEAEGRSAIAAGRCGAIILAGGMATRFGGRVKALVPVLGGHTFLGWKLRMLAHTASSLGVRLPVYIMTSFATDHAIRDALSAWQHPSLQLHTFTQGISLRLQRDGQLFRTQDGKLSTYAPGHGDVSWALYKSGLLADFRAQGGEHLWLSNVDNLGADLTPLLAGLHLRAGKAITVELAAKEAGDKGGAPARVDGALQIVEGFRFPPDFDQDTI